MFKHCLFILVIVAISIQLGAPIKCYTCEDCTSESLKGQWEEEDCAKENHYCRTVEETNYVHPKSVVTESRMCAAEWAACEDLYPPPFKYDPQFPDRIPPTYKCTTCRRDLCNS